MKDSIQVIVLVCVAVLSLPLLDADGATYDSENGYEGTQNGMVPADDGVASADPLIFNTTAGYFGSGDSKFEYANDYVNVISMIVDNGYSGAQIWFSGTVTNSGAFKHDDWRGAHCDYVFTGDMPGIPGTCICIITTTGFRQPWEIQLPVFSSLEGPIRGEPWRRAQ